MQFAAAEVKGMIAAMGADINIGALPARGVFQQAGKLVVLLDGSVTTSEPLLLLAPDDAALVVENDTIITIDAVQYQCIKKLPDGAGFIELQLTRDF